MDTLSGAGKNAAIARFAATICHDFANPLLGLQYLCEDFIRRGNYDEKDSELLRLGQREIERMKAVVVGLRSIYQPLTAPRQHCDLRGLIEASLAAMAAARAGRGIGLACELWPETLAALVISEKIRFVIDQLVENAIEAMPDGGVLTVSAAAQDGWIVISVGDTGCGLSALDEERLFEPFFSTKQGEATPFAKTTSRGFGLAASRHIMMEHGGDLCFRHGDNGGSVFIMTIPGISQQKTGVR